MCPLTISRPNEMAQCTHRSLIYSLLLCAVSWCISGKLNLNRLRANMLLETNVEIITNFMQTSFALFAYCVTALHHIATGRKHAKFLNTLHEIDRELIDKLKLQNDSQIDGRYYFRINAAKSIVLTAIYTFSVIAAEMFMGKAIDFNVTRTLYYILNFMLNSMFLFILHIQCCAELLHNRYRIIYRHFFGLFRTSEANINFYEILIVVQKLSDLKEDFENTFGFTILLMVALDFLLITKVIFIILYSILLSTKSIEYSTELLVLTSFNYIFWPITKNALLIMAIQRLADEVCNFLSKISENNISAKPKMLIGNRNYQQNMYVVPP